MKKLLKSIELTKVTQVMIFCIAFLTVCFNEVQTMAFEEELSLKEMLLTPGKLITGHAQLDSECKSCHEHFNKENQSQLCLDCHEKIQYDVNSKTSFHGLSIKVIDKSCTFCHSDHLGRDADITQLDKQNFNHAETNFPLTGIHTDVDCKQCHDSQNSAHNASSFLHNKLPVSEGYRFESFDCANCHQDVHDGSLGETCTDCHNADNWRPEAFDHSKTDFKLDAGHESLNCNSCHSDQGFEGLNIQCKSCHLSKDVHLGIFGTGCDDCHNKSEWPITNYDHFSETGFELKHSHLQLKGKPLACISCHENKLNPAKECASCHKDDDVHQNTNGPKCETCHNESAWNKVEFKHDLKSTGFELLASHQEQRCESCHLPGSTSSGLNTQQTKIRQCVDCHLAINPHDKKINSRCENCHSENSWNSGIRFSHDFSDFPLTGSHQLLTCDSCHIDLQYGTTQATCISCHAKDDYHEQSLGKECANCHDTSVWSHWKFDHQNETKFRLNGAHQNLQCGLCHTSELSKPLQPGSDCLSCHRQDDVHNGAFGTECEQCHTESSFGEL